MEIWQEIKKDGESGARRLVAEYGNRIYAAALLLSSNDSDAEELTFKTLERAVKKISLFDPQRSFFTWLYTILLNLHRMELRRKRLPVVPGVLYTLCR
jgi:RNA polymerase sigma factor (sigma-70 family)